MAGEKNSPFPLAPVLRPGQRIALITSYRLGDTLLSMIVVHNLGREGYEVEVFSQVLYALKEWFPGVNIFPFEALEAKAPAYDHIWYERPNRRVKELPSPGSGKTVILKKSPPYESNEPMYRVHQRVCRELLGIKQPLFENGMVLPQWARNRKVSNRIAIHPTSSSRFKNWPLSRFLHLAHLLKVRGLEAEFMVSPEEVRVARAIGQAGMDCYVQPDLSLVAARLGTAACFIGNDSGLGQLASNVGTPTLTLSPVPRKARRWRPCWSASAVVLPRLSERWPEIIRHVLWKYAIKPDQVLTAFEQLYQDQNQQKEV